MMTEVERSYPAVDPERLHAATVGILTGIAFGYHESDDDLPTAGEERYNWASCVATDALRASDEWKASR